MTDLEKPIWRQDTPFYEKTLITRGKWVDHERNNRSVAYKIYHPTQDSMTSAQKFPVIIWSHGLGGTRDGAGFIARYLARFGYIIVHVQHHGTDSVLWEGKAGHPWDNIRNAKIPRKAALQRYQDIPFALKCLEEGRDLSPQLQDEMDLQIIGMSGHSFGAGTTQIMAGQTLGRGRRLYQFKESRFKAGIVYSPIPSFNRDDTGAEIYGGIDIPLFHMTGTDDFSPVDETGYEKRLEVYEHAHKADQHAFILEDGDHMIYSGSRGQLGETDNRERYEQLIMLSSLAFWDSYLRNDARAYAWLTGEDFINYLGADGRYHYKEKNI
jgi:dienelactone hydrolase